MEKKDKEKLFFQTQLSYIESLDREVQSEFYKKLGLIGGIISFLVLVVKLDVATITPTILVIAFIFLVWIISTNNQDGKRVDDIYEDLVLAVKNDKLLKFEIKKRTFFEKYFYYKKRYK